MFYCYILSYTYTPLTEDTHSLSPAQCWQGHPNLSLSSPLTTTFHPNSFTSKRWYVLLHAWLRKWDTQQERSQCCLRASYEGGSSSSNSMFSHTVDLMQSSHCLCWEVGSLQENELNNALGQSYLIEDRCFLKYTVPLRWTKLKNPNSRLESHVLASVLWDTSLMKDAC